MTYTHAATGRRFTPVRDGSLRFYVANGSNEIVAGPFTDRVNAGIHLEHPADHLLKVTTAGYILQTCRFDHDGGCQVHSLGRELVDGMCEVELVAAIGTDALVRAYREMYPKPRI